MVVSVPKFDMDKLPIDTPIYICDDKCPRHYAGNYSYFAEGSSSFTNPSDQPPLPLKNRLVILGVDVTIDGVLYEAGMQIYPDLKH